MRTRAEEIAAELKTQREAIQSIFAKYRDEATKEVKAGDITDEDLVKAEGLKAAVQKLEKEYSVHILADENDEELKALNNPSFKHGSSRSRMPIDGIDDLEDYKKANRYAGLKFFQGPKAEKSAYRFSKFVMASVFGSESAKEYCKNNGMELKTIDYKAGHLENNNSTGGFLVPGEFSNTLIDLREMFGVFRGYANVSPMLQDTKTVPRRAGGLTAYYIGEGKQMEESQKNWDRVNLTARKMGVLTRYSSELDEDIAINLGDDLIGEIAYAFAIAEDQAGFNGDGTGTYGRIIGVTNAMLKLASDLGLAVTDIAGVVQAAGPNWDAITLKNFEAVLGRLPQYADGPDAAWYCHRTFYFTVMEPLALAAGGTTAAEVLNTSRGRTFLGYPVRFCQALPKTTAVSQIPVFFGSLKKGVLFGERRVMTIAMSKDVYFAEDEIGIRGTQRYDINVHDVGNASATASLREPGPIVALQTTAA